MLDLDKSFYALDNCTWSKIKKEYWDKFEVDVEIKFSNFKFVFEIIYLYYYFYFINFYLYIL